MENFGSPVFSVDSSIARKKRSNYARRPNPNPKPLSNYISSSSSSFLHNYGGYRNINEIYTNDNSSGCGREDLPLDTDEHGLNDLAFKSDRLGNESKLKKVKLKVGGVTHTIQTKSMAEITHSSRAFAENSAEDFHGKSSNSAKMLSMRLKMGEEIAGKGLQIRKSRRVPKKRTLDEEFTDEEEDDDEIRYLGKLRASKAASGYRDNQEIPESPDFDYTREYGASVLDKGGSKESLFREDKDYIEEDDLASDNELEDKKNKKEHLDSLAGSGNELTITTRKRALQYGKGASPASGPSVFFPNGLADAPSKRQKEMLPEVDQLLRKAEAAQRRRLQAEKAAKEAEAEAIRKILGQDSTRKKREDKIKRQQEELAQEKTAKAAVLGSNTVRWVMGPSGTVVTFSDDLGLPNIFRISSLSDSYPPPREKCVGPNCNNEYKYRDSKSKLPLCSLHCYKAVQG